MYALEQTAQANQQIKTCHVKYSPGGGMTEAWIQMKPDGTPLRARMDFPKTEDGDKVVILTEDKAEVWFKDKNSHLFITEKNALARMKQMQKEFDPKLSFEASRQGKRAEKWKSRPERARQRRRAITLTATSKETPEPKGSL